MTNRRGLRGVIQPKLLEMYDREEELYRQLGELAELKEKGLFTKEVERIESRILNELDNLDVEIGLFRIAL